MMPKPPQNIPDRYTFFDADRLERLGLSFNYSYGRLILIAHGELSKDAGLDLSIAENYQTSGDCCFL
jgi:hypothetical protein